MSASLDQYTDWNYRKTDQRLIIIKTVNEKVRKAAAVDMLTNLPFAIEIPDNIPLENVEAEKEYLAQLKVYTSKSIEEVDVEFISFFDALDVDQAVDDFIKAYWVYPNKIRFELADLEEP